MGSLSVHSVSRLFFFGNSFDSFDSLVNSRSDLILDTDTILASVARTGRLLVVSEDFPWGGVAAEVIARVTGQGYHLLDAPPLRVTSKDTPIPYHPDLWKAHRPHSGHIVEAARYLMSL